MRRNIRRLILGALIVLLAGGLWVGWQAYSVYRGINHITGIKVVRSTVEPVVTIPPLNGNKRFNVLVLGSDDDRKAEEARPLTQSMIVVTVDPLHHHVGLLSIPRDFWVPIRGHGYDKIDLANKYGGVQLARETVETLFKIPIHYYAWVGLSGFRQVVDTFNGVNLNISHPILDDFYPDDLRPGDPYAFKRIFIPPGWRHMSGRQALEYVRSRHGDLIGDFGRSSRQQQVLLALRKKADTLSVLENLPALVDDLQNSVRTDLSILQIRQLQQLSRQVQPTDIDRVVLSAPTYCRYGFVGPQSVLFPNWKVIRPKINAMFAPVQPPVQPPVPLATRLPLNPTPTLTATPTPPTATAVVPSPTAPPATPASGFPQTLPGRLIFERDGNIFELSRNRSLTRLTDVNATAMPSVSPGGRSIAFLRFTNYASDIWILDRKTTRLRQLTNDTSKDVHNNLWAAFPDWALRGKSLLYSSDRAKLSCGCPEDETRPVDLAIWSMPSRGGSPTQLTTPNKGSGGDTDPQWRPGTDEFLYVQWNYNAQNVPYSQLVLRQPSTGKTWYLTGAGQSVLQPEIDSNGRQITYVRDEGGISQIVAASLITTSHGPALGPGKIIAQGEVAQPAFTPGGRWVSYLQANGDNFGLYVAPAHGGTATQITEAGSNLDAISRPVWTR